MVACAPVYMVKITRAATQILTTPHSDFWAEGP